jgi:hypothetical protein
MGVPAEARRIYDLTRPAVAEVEAHVTGTLTTFARENEYQFIGRQKSLESFSEKLETGRFRRVSELDDLFACALIIPTASHEERVIAFLDRVYERVTLRGRGTARKAPEVFRFDTTRFIGRLRRQPGISYAEGVSGCAFEVQVRTVFEHAWTVVTHDLVYKPDDIDWQRLRLAAQLKAAVEQIEMIIAAFTTSASAIPVSADVGVEAEVEVLRRFKAWVEAGRIDREASPASWRRFAQSVVGVVRSYCDARRLGEAVTVLLDGLEARLTTREVPLSGSLFQWVIGFVGSGVIPGASLERFPVLVSRELGDFHGLPTVPLPLVVDWPLGSEG